MSMVSCEHASNGALEVSGLACKYYASYKNFEDSNTNNSATVAVTKKFYRCHVVRSKRFLVDTLLDRNAFRLFATAAK